MGEKTGFITVLLLFAIGIFPILLNTFTSQVNSSKILTVSTEIQQLVTAEGGVTDKVKKAVDKLDSQGYHIEFTDSNGNPVTGKVDVGKEVVINYEFNGFETSNSTIIMKR